MPGLTILIVDDSEPDRYLIKRSLRSSERITRVIEADDGRTALDLLSPSEDGSAPDFAGFPPALILLDINMPRVGGLEFLELFQELRKEQDLSSVVVMMYSSSEHEDDKKTAFSYDFVKDYVTKGSHTPQELESKILDALG